MSANMVIKEFNNQYKTCELSYFNIFLLKDLKVSKNIEVFNRALLPFGFYLAKSQNKNDEDRALHKLGILLDKVISYSYESRVNSRVNKIINALKNCDHKTIASTISSAYRTYLGECSMMKAQKSTYGYMCNGGHRQVMKFTEEELCEWCKKPIIIPDYKGFTCPHCRVYFHNFKPQKIKIKLSSEDFYFSPFDQNEEIPETLIKIEAGEFDLKKAKKVNAGQLVFIMDNFK